MGFIVFVMASMVIAVVTHVTVTRWWLASLISAGISSLAFQAAIAIRLGHLDKFVAVALPLTFVYSFVIAIVVGIPFILVRKQKGVKK